VAKPLKKKKKKKSEEEESPGPIQSLASTRYKFLRKCHDK
jgi:hypothetical protein